MKQQTKKSLYLNIAILIPIAFLIIYHSAKLFNHYLGNDSVVTDEFSESFTGELSTKAILTSQNIFRVIIILSLILVLLKKKIGIIGMWIGIGSLVVSQFYLASVSTSELIQVAHSGLKPLKGLMLPAIITYVFNKINKAT